MNAKYGNLYAGSTIKAGTYPGQTTDNKNTVVWNILVSNAKMSDQDAYNIVKTVFDKKADLVAVHSEAKNFTLENQVKSYSPIPWHPGAVKYMTEHGVKM
jgi:TRAP transporter TAXI family solute receptor